MTKAPVLDKKINRDIVLCSTTSHHVSRSTTDILLEEAIPFTANWKKIPFFKRPAYNGASEICIFLISPNIYTRARRTIRSLSARDRERLVMG